MTAVQTPTPMMAQYLEIKAEHPGALLFYRMGDFYELFFDDAVAASEALDITLTKRGKHDGADIAMCGVPVRAADGYLLTLIRKGFRVAVCEQMEPPEDARKRGAKSVVRREVVRLVTPGTLTEEALLEARRHNFLAAWSEVRGDGALAWVDISTGAFHVIPCPRARLGPELARLAPSEVVVPEAAEVDLRELVTESGAVIATVARSAFDSSGATSRLCALFNVGTLEAFGNFTRPELAAMGAITEYLSITQKGNLPLLRPPIREMAAQVMQIDSATRRNLELTSALSGGRAGSLLAMLDRTATASGARLLSQRLSSPSVVPDIIHARQDAVTAMIGQPGLREALGASLRQVPDLDRALSRLALGRGGPRDVASIRNALEQAETLARLLRDRDLPDLLADAAVHLTGLGDLLALLDDALVAEPPLLARDGEFIAAGHDTELDEARQLRDEGRGIIAGLQGKYAQDAGISSLKVKHNNVLGYFIETTALHAEKMMSPPLSDQFIHRQTTANQVRFTTLELSDLQSRIHNARGNAIDIEARIFEALKAAVLEQSGMIGLLSGGLAEFDLAITLADLAIAENWTLPKVDDSRAFAISGGRHPVVEYALKAESGASFIANDCDLSANPQGACIWLLTGPNMAGKSTFLRQNALIALLAQIGSYVPATKAHIGIVSQLFSRVGASDDLARGRSTFMVEMVETAAILNQADDRALVIMDEIGRGTATYDGLSIAWATLEHLHDVNRARGLFATHYHEMTALATKLDGVENATVAVREHGGDVIFLHEVRKGTADRSYGVQVAQLAGLPPTVVARARMVLSALEEGERSGGQNVALVDDLPLFSVAPPAPASRQSALEAKLKDIHPDDLSAREALNLVYELKKAADA